MQTAVPGVATDAAGTPTGSTGSTGAARRTSTTSPHGGNDDHQHREALPPVAGADAGDLDAVAGRRSSGGCRSPTRPEGCDPLSLMRMMRFTRSPP